MDVVYYREEEVLSCQDQLDEFKTAAGVLMKWLEETKEQVPVVQPNCSEQRLENDVKNVNVSALFIVSHTGGILERSPIIFAPGKKMHSFLFRENSLAEV